MSLKNILKLSDIEFGVSITLDENNDIVLSLGGNDNSLTEYKCNNKRDMIAAFKDYLDYIF